MDEEKKTLPITTGLRDAVHRYNKYSSMTMPCDSQTYVKCDAETFDRMCDAIDFIHHALEEENGRLRAELQECRPDSWESIIGDALSMPIHSEIDMERLVARCKALAEKGGE